MKGARWLQWLVAGAAMVSGSLAAHQAGYALTAPPGESPAVSLAATGHGYLGWAVPAVAYGLALALVGATALTFAPRASRHAPLHAGWFAVLPPLGFVVQEHVERTVHGGAAALTVLEPAFLAGLALQLPFAGLAYAACRWLGSLAGSIVRAVAPPPPAAAPAEVIIPARRVLSRRRRSPLSCGLAMRAPPCSA